MGLVSTERHAVGQLTTAKNVAGQVIKWDGVLMSQAISATLPRIFQESRVRTCVPRLVSQKCDINQSNSPLTWDPGEQD